MTDRLITRDELIEFFRDRDPSEQDVEDREAWATEAADAFVERFFEGAMLIMPNPVPETQIISLDDLEGVLDPEHMKLFTETRSQGLVSSKVLISKPLGTEPPEWAEKLAEETNSLIASGGGWIAPSEKLIDDDDDDDEPESNG